MTTTRNSELQTIENAQQGTELTQESLEETSQHLAETSESLPLSTIGDVAARKVAEPKRMERVMHCQRERHATGKVKHTLTLMGTGENIEFFQCQLIRATPTQSKR
jgi:hypothetical protein